MLRELCTPGDPNVVPTCGHLFHYNGSLLLPFSLLKSSTSLSIILSGVTNRTPSKIQSKYRDSHALCEDTYSLMIASPQLLPKIEYSFHNRMDYSKKFPCHFSHQIVSTKSRKHLNLRVIIVLEHQSFAPQVHYKSLLFSSTKSHICSISLPLTLCQRYFCFDS